MITSSSLKKSKVSRARMLQMAEEGSWNDAEAGNLFTNDLKREIWLKGSADAMLGCRSHLHAIGLSQRYSNSDSKVLLACFAQSIILLWL